MTNLEKIFRVNVAEKKWQKIILWWEIRRLLYNFFLILFLSITLGVLSILPNKGFIILYNGPVLVFGMYLGILLFFLFANLFYTTGWVFQLITRNSDWKKVKILTKKSFVLGIIISFLITLIPVLFAVLNLIFTSE